MRPQRISRKGRALSPRGVAAALTTIALFAASDAFAFEREWHLGGGVGASDFSAEGVGWGPELGVHGAYGLSDSFDLRLEARLSQHPVTLSRQGVDDRWTFLRSELAIAYKLDILRWVPWIAVGAGGFHSFTEPLPTQDLRRFDGLVSAMFGLDYAVTRSFGLGVVGRSAFLFAGSGEYGAQLRAEYRWGF